MEGKVACAEVRASWGVSIDGGAEELGGAV